LQNIKKNVHSYGPGLDLPSQYLYIKPDFPSFSFPLAELDVLCLLTRLNLFLMKTVKKVCICLLIVSPLLAAPTISRAGGLGDILHAIFGNDQDKKPKKDKDGNPPPPPPSSWQQGGTSVPVDDGMVFLLAVGLGFGAWKLYGRNGKEIEQAII
jgi:hypothetical protein